MSTLSSPSSQYLVQSILKEGSYEKLTKCVNIATRKTVYLKILNSRSALPEKEKELLILKHLRKFDPDNFNIVRCNSVFFKAEKIFIEYEMLGQTLFDFVKDRPSHCMTLNEIRPILHQVWTSLYSGVVLLDANVKDSQKLDIKEIQLPIHQALLLLLMAQIQF